MRLEGLVREVEELLPGPVRVLEDLSFSNRALVARLAVGESTVVAKRPHREAAFRNELEALTVLPERVRAALVAAGAQTIVMEDLGSGPSLADLLLGDDPVAAETALMAWASTLGAALAPTLRDGEGTGLENLQDGLDQLCGFAADLGIAAPSEVRADVDRISALLAEPGPWLAFCPGDTCPDNNRVYADGSVRLFDFERAGWRHAAMEAAYCRAPFCTCWCVAGLPTGLTDQMEQTFVESLSPPDRDRFTNAVGVAAVGYTLATFGFFRQYVMNDSPVGPPDRAPSTGRQYLYSRLEMIMRDGQLPALAEFADRVAIAMRRRWPEAAALPRYPAFR
jgi:hypothetical protein